MMSIEIIFIVKAKKISLKKIRAHQVILGSILLNVLKINIKNRVRKRIFLFLQVNHIETKLMFNRKILAIYEKVF